MINKLIKQEYEKDFYAWAMHSAELIRQGKFSEVDIENVAEEIESMGKSERREISSRLAVLIAHLLKWKYQPERHGNSWKYTIEEQRLEINELLEESPSLKYELKQQVNHVYRKALLLATKETGLNIFPSTCPFSLKEILDSEYLPAN